MAGSGTLTRPRSGRLIAGVCVALARRLVEAMVDGKGALLLYCSMEDEASEKQ